MFRTTVIFVFSILTLFHAVTYILHLQTEASRALEVVHRTNERFCKTRKHVKIFVCFPPTKAALVSPKLVLSHKMLTQVLLEKYLLVAIYTVLLIEKAPCD